MDYLYKKKLFTPPRLQSLEEVTEYGIRLKAGRVFADTWDIERFSECPGCFQKRKERLIEMNLFQVLLPPVDCQCPKPAI